jgi:hypothetical protein
MKGFYTKALGIFSPLSKNSLPHKNMFIISMYVLTYRFKYVLYKVPYLASCK